MNNYNNNFERNCPSPCNDEIAMSLRKIVRLQKEAIREELADEMCDADFLGNGRDCKICDFNTRPLQIFTHEDKTWECPVERNEDGCNNCRHDNDSRRDNEKTCVFRVEKVEDGTATFRALIDKREDNHDGHEEKDSNRRRKNERFKATDSFITIKLIDIAAFRCLKDTFCDICIRNI